MSNNQDVILLVEHEKTPEEMVRGHIQRLLGSETGATCYRSAR